jgi:hypothetical protein
VPKLGSEESIRVQRLQSELVVLQRQIAQKDEEYNKKCTVVKQELDKLKSDYAACTQSCKQLRLQAQSGNVPSESEQSAVNRIKDLEKQVLHHSLLNGLISCTIRVQILSSSKIQKFLGPLSMCTATFFAGGQYPHTLC